MEENVSADAGVEREKALPKDSVVEISLQYL